jgi:hypothetical protein
VSLILSWVLFPLVLAAIGAGWGVLVERAAGARLNDVLLLPVGLAAALVVAGSLTTFTSTAPAANTTVAVGAAAGLILLAWPRVLDRAGRATAREPAAERQPGPRRWPLLGRWPLLAAVGAFLVYGAPVLLSGQATFTGYLKLDDTATWFNVTDIVMSHSHSLAALKEAFHPPSDFTTVFIGDVGEHYPLGAFMLLGVGHGLTGIDPAWIIQPYFACCAAALALSVYALIGPLVPSPRLRALVAFLAAQPALLYGYSLWGGIKEMTAAFVLALGIALAAPLMRRPPAGGRELRALLPLAVAAAALIQTLQVGGGGWVGPALLLLAIAWLVPRPRLPRLRVRLVSLVGLAAMTAALILPVWVALSSFLSEHFSGLFSEGQTVAEKYGNLIQPTSGWQLAGIWPAGDFRYTAPALPTVPFIVVGVIAAAAALWSCLRRRQFGPPLYVAVVLSAGGLVWATGTTPWVLGKSLAISSPALLTAALTGAAMLWRSRRAPLSPVAGGAQASPEAERVGGRPPVGHPAAAASLTARWRRHAWVLGPLTMLVLAGGVLYSNVLAYSDVTLAPRARLAEVQHIGQLVAAKGPTFMNYYEAYADRHFLRDGAPVEPAEFRPVTLPLRNGVALTKAAWANLDAFPLSTLMPYRSIVTIRSPIESRPPSIYNLVWQGRYYQLWQRPEPAPATILEHIPYGEENIHPYCGNAQNGKSELLCALNPVSIPSCPQLLGFARTARERHAHLVAYQRAEPVFARGDDVLWPASWTHETEAHALVPTTPGTAVGHVAVPNGQRYELFIDGSFGGRGLEVSVDGRKVGAVEHQLSGYISSIPVASLYLSAGVHRFEYTYPHADLAPGGGETVGTGEFAVDSRFTAFWALVLQPLEYPRSELISVAPGEVKRLCERPLEWVELVSGSVSGP